MDSVPYGEIIGDAFEATANNGLVNVNGFEDELRSIEADGKQGLLPRSVCVFRLLQQKPPARSPTRPKAPTNGHIPDQCSINFDHSLRRWINPQLAGHAFEHQRLPRTWRKIGRWLKLQHDRAVCISPGV